MSGCHIPTNQETTCTHKRYERNCYDCFLKWRDENVETQIVLEEPPISPAIDALKQKVDDRMHIQVLQTKYDELLNKVGDLSLKIEQYYSKLREFEKQRVDPIRDTLAQHRLELDDLSIWRNIAKNQLGNFVTRINDLILFVEMRFKEAGIVENAMQATKSWTREETNLFKSLMKAPQMPIVWKCTRCNAERPDAAISVAKHEFDDGILTINVKYCNDNESCNKWAHDRDEIKKHYGMEYKD